MKSPVFIARKILFPCAALLEFVAFFLAVSTVTIWWHWPWLLVQSLWLSIAIVVIAIALLWGQLIYLPKFLRFVSGNFELAYPGWSLTLRPHLQTITLIFSIAFVVGVIFWPEYFVAFLAFYALVAVIDLAALVTLLGLGLHWKRLAKRRLAEGQAEVVSCEQAPPVGFAPIGFVCELDLATGEIHIGMMTIGPDGSAEVVVSDTGEVVIPNTTEGSTNDELPIVIQQDADDPDKFHL